VTVPVTTFAQDGSVLSQDVSIQLTGNQASGYIGPITFNPEGYVSGTSAPTGPAVVAGLGKGKVHANVNGKTVAKTSTAFQGKLTIRFMTRDGSQLTPPAGGDPANAGLQQQTEIGEDTDEYAELVHIRIAAENPYDPTQLQPWKGEVALKEAANGLFYPGDSNHQEDYQYFYDGGIQTTKIDSNGRVDGSYLKMVAGKVELTLKAAARIRRDKNDRNVIVHPPYYGEKGSHIAASVVAPGDPSRPKDSAEVIVNEWVDERTYESRRDNPQAGWGGAMNTTTDWVEKKIWDSYVKYPTSGDPETEQALSLVEGIWEDFNLTRAGEVRCTAASDSATCHIVYWNPGLEAVRYFHPGKPLYESAYKTLVGAGQKPITNLLVHEARHCWQYDLVVRDQNPLNDNDHDMAPESPPASATELRDAPNGMGSDKNPDLDLAGDQVADPTVVVALGRERDAVRNAADAENEQLECTLFPQPHLVFPTTVPLIVNVGTTVTCKVMPEGSDPVNNIFVHPAGIPIRWTINKSAGDDNVDCKLMKNGNDCGSSCISTALPLNPGDTDAVAIIGVTSTGPATCEVTASHVAPQDPPDCDTCDDAWVFMMIHFK